MPKQAAKTGIGIAPPKTKRDKLNPSATLKQIAAEANVSITTVSRILSGESAANYSPVTTELIREIAKRLRYRPNMLVRGIRSGETKTVGLMIPAHYPFYGQILSGAHDALVRADYVPIVLWSGPDSISGEGRSELEQIHQLVDRRVEGIILKPVMDAASDDYLHEVLDRKIPLVVVDRELANAHTDFVGTDDELGGRLVAQHLLELGHRRILHLAAATSLSTARRRRSGFEDTLAAHAGIEYEALEMDETKWDPDPERLCNILSGPNRPTALFFANDEVAANVYDLIGSLGLKIPQNISVVGFADMPLASHLRPRLTTVHQDPYQIGASAAELLLARCDSTKAFKTEQKILLAPQMVVRESTGPVTT